MTSLLVVLAIWNGIVSVLWLAAALAIADQKRTLVALTERLDALQVNVQVAEAYATNANQVASATARYAFTPIGNKAS